MSTGDDRALGVLCWCRRRAVLKQGSARIGNSLASRISRRNHASIKVVIVHRYRFIALLP